jgi:hypothetical protein
MTMRTRRFAFSIPALALALALPASVLASGDQAGAEGRAKTIEVYTPSADTYLQYHGRIVIAAGKTSTEYRWGGTSCGTRTMTPEMVALLVDAVRNQDATLITPTFQNGQGSSKCLVGFALKNNETTAGNPGNGKPKPRPR